jgi:hypothetical protein
MWVSRDWRGVFEGITLVLLILVSVRDFDRFGLPSLSLNLRRVISEEKNVIYIYPIILSPIRGGAIIGVFMIQA